MLLDSPTGVSVEEEGGRVFRDGFGGPERGSGRPVSETTDMAKTNQKITLSAAQNIPFEKLQLSQANVRQVKAGVSIEDLAADIAHRGLIASLNVRPVLDANGEATGMYKVPAGGRRFRALELLVKQKKLARTEPVPCIVSTATTSEEEDSLAENVQRQSLHPLDQFRAFQTLRDQGLSEEEIAARFFVGTATVKQRLRLASVSPKLLDLYAGDEMKLEQVMAFSINNDHARQEQVWATISQSHVREPYYIKRLLTETAIRADDRRAVYVGAEAYERAGGDILRDLFEQDRGGWYQDPALLEQLAFEKLKSDTVALKAEGWKWVEGAIDFAYGHTAGMRRIHGQPKELSAEELARHCALRAEYDQLDAEYAEATDYDADVERKLEQLGGELDALNDRPHVYNPDEIARAGVFVMLDSDGTLRIERGFIRPEDDQGTSGPGTEPDKDGVVDEVIGDHSAGVVVNGQSTDGAVPEEEDNIRPLPDRLVLDLTAQRTLALRNALANDPVAAFVAALHAYVLQVFYHFASDTSLELSLKSANFPQTQGLADTVWAKEIDERQEAWRRDLPKDETELWEFLIGLDDASRQALFAHCVSLSVNAVMEPWNRRPRARARRPVGTVDRLRHGCGRMDTDVRQLPWARDQGTHSRSRSRREG
ncbi:chromosome partitioning protein, ParB family [Mesorhizobium qingshengii]|uniref:Chromosome partitioning protein, ParB family n=1 Tax=Mesorhizobium qingshengii TaxID=1165689 RepID=A0A1G5ZPT8_9HYPH|nr:chromosome partitioning protein, ParB family [Mesorhizobium qingshengii]